jgi:hypothetical protein
VPNAINADDARLALPVGDAGISEGIHDRTHFAAGGLAGARCKPISIGERSAHIGPRARERCSSIKGEATAPAVGELYAVLFRGWGSPASGQSCGRFVLRGRYVIAVNERSDTGLRAPDIKGLCWRCLDGSAAGVACEHVTMRYVTVGELRDGLPVEFLGEEPDAVGVISEALTSRAVALHPGHPGRVWRTQPQHVQVSWVGLEEEAASYAYGFDADSLLPSGRVIGLGHLAEADFAQRETVMAEVLADEGDLTGWLPPWPGLPNASA